MKFQNFNSLYELFCVFNFAYVITDSLGQNNYVIRVGDMVLKCFSKISLRLAQLDDPLAFYQQTVDNLKPRSPKLANDVNNSKARYDGVLQARSLLVASILENKVNTYKNSFVHLYQVHCCALLHRHYFPRRHRTRE